MSEDYTWDETVTAHGYAVQNAGLRRDNATLAQRVMELEAQLANAQERQSAQFGRNTARLADVALDAERQTQRVMELERENAELRARLEAVPVAAIRKITFEDKRSFGIIRAEQTVAGWLATFDTQPADAPDAPLTLAQIDDEDGDE